ncbi:MAG: hypothetical protein PHX18_07000 [Candidatus Gastranaerophilales bacterium]|nr:hypothetical protein [Candidatus Gastranaerophilales bacterium]
MRKFIYFIILILAVMIPMRSLFAVEYTPKYHNNIKNYGIGLYFATGAVTIYEQPDEKSRVLEKMNWDNKSVYTLAGTQKPQNVFAVFSPKKGMAGFIALDEEETSYTKIIYNGQSNLSGWIKNDPDCRVFYWGELFQKFGSARGLYFFADTRKEDRILRLTPQEDGAISYEFLYPKAVKAQLVRGNWVLLRVGEYDGTQKIGWFKWRNADGTLNMFLNIED